MDSGHVLFAVYKKSILARPRFMSFANNTRVAQAVVSWLAANEIFSIIEDFLVSKATGWLAGFQGPGLSRWGLGEGCCSENLK